MRISIEWDDKAPGTTQDDLINHKSSTTAHASENITYNGEATGSNVKQALDGLDTRIDSLIITGGESSPEVTDARGGYPVLKGRLDASDAHLAETMQTLKQTGFTVLNPYEKRYQGSYK